MKKTICLCVVLLLCACFALAGCEKKAVTLLDTRLTDGGETVITLSDGTVLNLGEVKGKEITLTKAELDEKSHLLLTYSDGSKVDAGELDTGAKYESCRVDEEKHLFLHFSDGSEIDVGYVGVEVKITVVSQIVNEEKHLVLTYSDGSVRDAGYVGVDVPMGVVSQTVNGDYHLILKYENGTEVDAGFVGMVLPDYTVTFVNHEGKTLSVQTVTYGKSANAPVENPARKGYSFTGWKEDYTNITGDLTVHPVYEKLPTKLVMFHDYDEAILDTQFVIVGEDAVAPDVPERIGFRFIGWSCDFTNVTTALDVYAQYEEIVLCEVCFYNKALEVFHREFVEMGQNCTPPEAPAEEGFTFTGWNGLRYLTPVSQPVVRVYAKYEEIAE